MYLSPEQIQNAINMAYTNHAKETGGANADYIPFLKNVDSNLCGLSVVTVDGQVFSAGDADTPFAIESISKVCTLALAMNDWGQQAIMDKIGVDATGMPFNSVMALELHGDKPMSPLVNAGAISAASLIKADSREHRWSRILQMQSDLTGTDIQISDELNESEQTTNFHNRAIAWLLYAAGYLYCEPDEAVDVYTRQCSTLLTTKALATMGATIAAGGINPITDKDVIKEAYCASILAEMTMEGMYDTAGDWAFTVGLPAKSGVGGGILAVVPGVMAIAGFSPPLDPIGNSVRGQKMVASVAQTLGFNLYQCARKR